MIYDKSINVNRLKDMKLILMRTPNEKLGFIKHEWIENIHISWRDKQELTLSIPSISLMAFISLCTSFLTKGSPPVILTLLIPIFANCLHNLIISS